MNLKTVQIKVLILLMTILDLKLKTCGIQCHGFRFRVMIFDIFTTLIDIQNKIRSVTHNEKLLLQI